MIPPTGDALALYTKQIIYQGSLLWGQMLEPNQILLTHADWRWQRTANSIWELVWTTLPPASEACHVMSWLSGLIKLVKLISWVD